MMWRHGCVTDSNRGTTLTRAPSSGESLLVRPTTPKQHSTAQRSSPCTSVHSASNCAANSGEALEKSHYEQQTPSSKTPTALTLPPLSLQGGHVARGGLPLLSTPDGQVRQKLLLCRYVPSMLLCWYAMCDGQVQLTLTLTMNKFRMRVLHVNLLFAWKPALTHIPADRSVLD